MLPRLETDPDEEFTGAEIRDLTARVTASHRSTGIGTVLSDAVSVISAAAVTAGLVIGASGVVRDLLLAAPAGSSTPGLSLATVRILLLVAGAALATGLAARLGPLGVSGAGLRWWLPMPVDRRSLLAPRVTRALLLWSMTAAAYVVLLTASTGVPVSGRSLATSGATGAVCGALLVTLVGLAQRRRAVVAATVVVCDLVLALTPVLGVALLAAGLGGDTGQGSGGAWWGGAWWSGAWWSGAWWDGAWWDGAWPVWTVLAVLGSLVGVGAWWWHRSLEGLGAVALTPATAVAEHAGTSVVSLDLRELGRALDRPGVRRSPRRSTEMRWVRGPVTAVLATETIAVVRNPVAVVQVLGLGALIVLARGIPGLAGGLGLGVVLLAVGLRSAQLGAQGARSAELSPVLDSLLPLSARATRLGRAVVPAAAAFVSLLVGCAPQVVGDPRWLALLAAAAGCFGAAAVRGAYRRPPTWSAPLLATPAGAVPTGALSMVTRGPDLAVLGAVPLLVAVVVGVPGWGLVGLQVLFAAAALAVCSGVGRGST